MIVTAVTVTAGRTRQLQEALACFEAQDYPDKRMVILNTFPKQTIQPLPGVFVINMFERPKSLGSARNDAVRSAPDGVIVVWDDDDLYLSSYLSRFAEAFSETGAEWVRMVPVWYAEQYEIRKSFNTWVNSVAFTKEAWNKVGGYPQDLSVGEDQTFFKKLSEQCKGATLNVPDAGIAAIYCWGQGAGVYHISGLGVDKPGDVPAWERYQKDLDARVATGREPIGTIKLVPKLEHDPKAMVDKYLNAQIATKRPPSNKEPVCFIQLGRYGDIINILPLLYHCAQTYDVPHLMVSREFADVLDGCSYVEPEVVPLRNEQIIEAHELANRKFKRVVNCQIWGHKWIQERRTPAYNWDSWVNAGFGYMFNCFHRYPVFDKRDREKEKAYTSKLFTTEKPKILVNVASLSSPFKRGPELLVKLKEAHGEQFEVVDVTGLRVDHIYDLLGAIEQSGCVVSADTSLVHLTAATGTPLVAIVNPSPWQGSIPRCGLSRVFTYTEIESMLDGNAVGGFDTAIRDYASSHAFFNHPLDHLPPLSPPHRTIYHVVERHEERNTAENQRKREAQASWDALYRQGVVPCHFWEPYPRNAKQDLGDPRALPFLKDVIAAGMARAGYEDIILWCNDDNWLHPLLPDLVKFHCSLWGVCTSQRCEFRDGPILPDRATPDQFAMAGRLHMGRDIFAATKSWLEQHWDEIPDFVIGCSDFDLCLACMVRNQWGYISTRRNLEDTMWPAELKRGYVSHQYHPPKWREAGYETKAAGQLHNRRLFREWGAKYLPSLKFNADNTI